MTLYIHKFADALRADDGRIVRLLDIDQTSGLGEVTQGQDGGQ